MKNEVFKVILSYIPVGDQKRVCETHQERKKEIGVQKKKKKMKGKREERGRKY